MLHLIEGPAGGGKSRVARDLLRAGTVDVVADVTSLWAALSGAVRGPDGLFPVTSLDDPALRAALFTQNVAARFALDQGASVAVTTSRPGQVERWQAVADEVDAGFSVRTVDPGRAVVTARLTQTADPGRNAECSRAIGRWYR